MVYCGRPSTGCGNCKSRRIKCDEARPHCKNCIKTTRDCPGYRAEMDLIFRKEEPGRRKRAKKSPSNTIEASTSARKRRHHELEGNVELDDQESSKRQRRGTDVGVEGYKSLQWVYINARRANSVPDLARTKLSPSIEKQAKAFFMNKFVSPSQCRDTEFEFLQTAAPLVEQAKAGSALSLAAEAVAIAVMARAPGYEHLIQHGAQHYGRALAATQKAMQDPAHATSDETLLAILLFALYESITSSEHSTTAWTKHIEGAIAIVRARGVEQFENPRSLELFRIVRTQMLTNALHQRKPIQEFPGPNGWLSDMEDNDSAGFDILRTCVAMPSLLSRACSLLSRSDSPDLRVQVEALLEDAINAQNSLSAWEGYMPKQWAHTSFETTASPSRTHGVEEANTRPDSTHMYKGINVASIRNNTRVNEMLCSSVVIDALKWLYHETYTEDKRYQSAKSSTRTLVDDICRSVSFHLFGENVGNSIRREVADETNAMGAQFLIWPLYTAMNVRCIPDLQRCWLRKRLLAVARRYGQGILERVNGECSEHDEHKLPTSCPDQSSYGVQDSNGRVNTLDHQPSSWLGEQLHQLDEMKIDPALLMDDCKEHQKLALGGFDMEQEVPALSTLHREPIQVV